MSFPGSRYKAKGGWAMQGRKFMVIAKLAEKPEPVKLPESKVQGEVKSTLVDALRKGHAERSAYELMTIKAWLRMIQFPPSLQKADAGKSPRRQSTDLALDLDLMISCMTLRPTSGMNELITMQGDPDAKLHMLLSGMCAVYRVDIEGKAFEPLSEQSPKFSEERAAEERAFVLRRLHKCRIRERGYVSTGKPISLPGQASQFRPPPTDWKEYSSAAKQADAKQLKKKLLSSYRAQRLANYAYHASRTPGYRVPGASWRRLGSAHRFSFRAKSERHMRLMLPTLDETQQVELDKRLHDDAIDPQRAERAATFVAARMRGVTQRNVLGSEQAAATYIEALSRGTQQRARLGLQREASTKMTAMVRGRNLRHELEAQMSAATFVQARFRGRRARRLAEERRAEALISTADLFGNLQVRRTGTLTELSCFNARSVLVPSTCDAIVVCNAPTDLVVLDSTRYRDLRLEKMRSDVDVRAALLRRLPVFQQAAENALNMEVSTARQLAIAESVARGEDKETQLGAGHVAAKNAAAAATARANDNMKGFASGLKETSLAAGEHAQPVGTAKVLLVTAGELTLVAKNDRRQHTLTLLSLQPGAFYSFNAVGAIPNIADPVLSCSAPCTCLLFNEGQVTQALGPQAWVLLDAQIAATTQRVRDAVEGFSRATAQGQPERFVPPNPNQPWRDGPPYDCSAPLFVASDEQLISKRLQPIGPTEEDTEATRERLVRLADYRAQKQQQPKEKTVAWSDLLKANEAERQSLWRCRWCDCTAELGKGMGPEGQLTLCFACSHDFLAGRKDAPDKKQKQHNEKFQCPRCSETFVTVDALQKHTARCKVGLEGHSSGKWRCFWCQCTEKEAVSIERGPLLKTVCSLCAAKWRAGYPGPSEKQIEEVRSVSRQSTSRPPSAHRPGVVPLRQANFSETTLEYEEEIDGTAQLSTEEKKSIGSPLKHTPKLDHIKVFHQSYVEVELTASGRLPPRERNKRFDHLFVKPTPQLSLYEQSKLEARDLARSAARAARIQMPRPASAPSLVLPTRVSGAPSRPTTPPQAVASQIQGPKAPFATPPSRSPLSRSSGALPSRSPQMHARGPYFSAPPGRPTIQKLDLRRPRSGTVLRFQRVRVP